MTHSNSQDRALYAEIHNLVTAQLNDDITEAQAAWLEQLVLDNPRARQIYVRYMQETVALDRMMAGQAALPVAAEETIDGKSALTEAIDVEPPVERSSMSIRKLADVVDDPVSRRKRRRKTPVGAFVTMAVVGAAAAALIGALLVNLGPPEQPIADKPEPEQAPLPEHRGPGAPVARIAASVGSWKTGPSGSKDLLPNQRLQVETGVVQVALASGATLLVEAPAELQATGRNEVRLLSGQLVASVPPRAAGFTVLTDSAELKDLGTEFGVRKTGPETEAHVFQGVVEGKLASANTQAGTPQQATRLTAARAAKFDRANAAVTPIAFDAKGFSRFMPTGGLWGEYFDEQELIGRVTTRIDGPIDFSDTTTNWTVRPAGTQVAPDNIYSERWTGFVKIDRPGRWQFTTVSNDGVRLWVAGEQIIKNWKQHTDRRDRGTLELKPGWHPIRLEHFQEEKEVTIRLSFSGPGQPEIVIPSTHLSAVHPVTGERVDE